MEEEEERNVTLAKIDPSALPPALSAVFGEDNGWKRGW